MVHHGINADSVVQRMISMHMTFLQLHTNNLPALQAFYSSLGFHVTLHDEYIDIPIGTTLLRFQFYDTPLSGGYHFAINVAVTDIAIVRDWLRAHTPIIQSTQGTTIFQFDEWHAQAIYCYDPDNNIVEFIVRSDIVTHPHTSFRVADSLCISEIGLACTDVPATIAQFRNSVTIPDFFSHNAEFWPIGDNHGLFIMVQSPRLWYPDTPVPAALMPVTVKFHTAPNQHWQLDGYPYRITSADD
jgi:catechol-2,3-dioxygenase